MDETTSGAALHNEDADARKEAARLLGQSRSEAKIRAARENGRKGGRPKGIPVSEETRKKMSESKKTRDARRNAGGREEGGAT